MRLTSPPRKRTRVEHVDEFVDRPAALVRHAPPRQHFGPGILEHRLAPPDVYVDQFAYVPGVHISLDAPEGGVAALVEVRRVDHTGLFSRVQHLPGVRSIESKWLVAQDVEVLRDGVQRDATMTVGRGDDRDGVDAARIQHVPVVGIPQRNAEARLHFAERVLVSAAERDDFGAVNTAKVVEVRFGEPARADNADPHRRIHWHCYAPFTMQACRLRAFNDEHLDHICGACSSHGDRLHAERVAVDRAAGKYLARVE